MNRRGLKSVLVLMAIILVSIVLFNEIGNTIAVTRTFYGGASCKVYVSSHRIIVGYSKHGRAYYIA